MLRGNKDIRQLVGNVSESSERILTKFKPLAETLGCLLEMENLDATEPKCPAEIPARLS